MPDWTGVIAIEGEPSGDGRMIDAGALQWDDGPWPVIWDREDGDHTGTVVGTMDRIWRDGSLIRAEGQWSRSDDPEAVLDITRAQELVYDGAVGVSIAMDSETVQYRERIAPQGGMVESGLYIYVDPSLPTTSRTRPWSAAAARNRVFALYTENGEVDTFSVSRAFLYRDPGGDPTDPNSYALGVADVVNGTLRLVPRAVEAAAAKIGSLGLNDADTALLRHAVCALYERLHNEWAEFESCPFAEEMATLATFVHDDVLSVVTSGRVRHLAIVDTPAFAEARIGLVAVGAPLVAAAPSVEAVFTSPMFGKDGHTDPRLVRQAAERPGEAVTWGAPLTITEDGIVYGHAALWGRCHSGFRDRCVIPPRGGDYSRFLHGKAAPGVRTGVLTAGTTHARLQASPQEAMDHYSNTGRAVADVTVGEDAHGLWVSGRLRPRVDERDLADLRGSSLSGDWRPANGKYRLCGLLAVNQPGYLVQRPAIAASDGVITAGPCSCESPEMDLESQVAILEARLALLESLVLVS